MSGRERQHAWSASLSVLLLGVAVVVLVNL